MVHRITNNISRKKKKTLAQKNPANCYKRPCKITYLISKGNFWKMIEALPGSCVSITKPLSCIPPSAKPRLMAADPYTIAPKKGFISALAFIERMQIPPPISTPMEPPAPNSVVNDNIQCIQETCS